MRNFLPEDVRQQNKGTFMGSAKAFATLAAGFSTVFAVPFIWAFIADPIGEALIRLYDRDIAVLLYWGLHITLYPMIFFLLRMTLVTAFVSAAVIAATRFV